MAAGIGQIKKAYADDEARPEGETFALSSVFGRKPEVVSLCLEVLARGRKIPVLVDKIEPIKDLQLAVWLEFPRVMRRPENRMLKGFFFDGSRMISLIDFEQVLAGKGR